MYEGEKFKEHHSKQRFKLRHGEKTLMDEAHDNRLYE